MNLAVKLWGDFSEGDILDPIVGIPPEWPYLCEELGDSEELPGENWVLMTVEEYTAYRAQHQAAYDSFINGL